MVAAFKKIADAKAPFVSRGDDSGTHKAELRLWQDAGVDAKAASGTWYREAGSGMGATLNTGVGMGAYVFTDRATWSSFKNRGDSRIVVEGDKKLFNQYGVMLVNPARHPKVKQAEGQAFIDWVLSSEGPGRDPLVPDQRRAAVLPQRQPDWVNGVIPALVTRGCPRVPRAGSR